ncbi:MAG: type II toxin-antitoxin system RelE/ParE family toxin [Bacteroidetes bacterium]|nr:type II toxin-antitoxin system RelE/ParE family toxin [Bacteroidota bacterium]
MPIKVLHSGNSADVMIVVGKNASVPAQAFIESLTVQEQKGILQVLIRFAEFGVIHDEQRFRHEGDGVYVFKYKQVRLCCFFKPNSRPKTVIITHGFKKKSMKMDPSEKNRTLRTRESLEQEKSI